MGDGGCVVYFRWFCLLIISLPEASLSSFGKKVTKETDLGEALRLYLSGLIGFDAFHSGTKPPSPKNPFRHAARCRHRAVIGFFK